MWCSLSYLMDYVISAANNRPVSLWSKIIYTTNMNRLCYYYCTDDSWIITDANPVISFWCFILIDETCKQSFLHPMMRRCYPDTLSISLNHTEIYYSFSFCINIYVIFFYSTCTLWIYDRSVSANVISTCLRRRKVLLEHESVARLWKWSPS